ncbi:hypothetical protein PYCC9005_002995 [Savitreella phatthalungensis]
MVNSQVSSRQRRSERGLISVDIAGTPPPPVSNETLSYHSSLDSQESQDAAKEDEAEAMAHFKKHEDDQDVSESRARKRQRTSSKDPRRSSRRRESQTSSAISHMVARDTRQLRRGAGSLSSELSELSSVPSRSPSQAAEELVTPSTPHEDDGENVVDVDDSASVISEASSTGSNIIAQLQSSNDGDEETRLAAIRAALELCHSWKASWHQLDRRTRSSAVAKERKSVPAAVHAKRAATAGGGNNSVGAAHMNGKRR